MKRWNGWGYQNVNAPLNAEGQTLLEETVGEARPQSDAALEDVVRSVPQTRIKPHPLITTEPAERVLHSSGHSLPDWIAKRSGRYPAFVDGVAYPTTNEQVRELIAYAKATGTRLIPFGGGTSVVGHLTPLADVPVIALSMDRMKDLLIFDEKNALATFQAGIVGPDIEAKLRARGFTLGHYPQSFEFSTLGGWIATRSSGQQSRAYGRIEQMFAGGSVETPLGALTMRPYPASAAGPDLRELVLGSEGRLGVITEAVMRVSPLPEYESFEGIIFPTFDQGAEALRHIAQLNLPVSMLRLSNAAETRTSLRLADSRLIPVLERYVSVRGAKDEKCVMIFGLTGRKSVCWAARREVRAIASTYGGVYIGAALGKSWRKSRFHTPYLRNSLWDLGYAVDTVETVTSWTRAHKMMTDIESAITTTAAAQDERAHAYTHLSHVYPTGTSVYTTYVFRIGDTPEQTLRRWQSLKAAASEAIVNNEGTISHQHGVGTDHAPYLAREKGTLGMHALQQVFNAFDPSRVMNPGKLISTREEAQHVG